MRSKINRKSNQNQILYGRRKENCTRPKAIYNTDMSPVHHEPIFVVFTVLSLPVLNNFTIIQ